MYRSASVQLRAAGYEHYEISNYALPGCRSVHNQVYWASQSCYGFGLGAASFLQVGLDWIYASMLLTNIPTLLLLINIVVVDQYCYC